MQEAIVWLLLIELIGLAAWPLVFQVFRHLPERGYSLAKPAGLLGLAWLVWFVSMLGLPFNALLAWAGFAVLFGGLNLWLLLRRDRQLLREMSGWLAEHKWLALAAEAIFVLAYAYLVNLRTYMPDIRDQEKFGDYAFLNSLSLFERMPPADPWMSGYPINYYYFSHFMMALLVKMTGINPAIAFNLSVPLIFGLTCLGSFGLVYNLVALARGRTGGSAWRIPALSGLLGLAMVSLLGNLDSVRQIVAPRPDKGEYTPGNFFFSWWTPSRVIHDYMPQPNGFGGFTYTWSETINEFPMFSFLLADMHPHVMTLPTVILVIGLALNILVGPVPVSFLNLRQTGNALLFGLTALAVGGLYFLNTWDYPTYLLLVVAAAFLRTRLNRPAIKLAGGRLRHPIVGWLGWSAGLAVLSLLLYLPFHLTFVSLVGDNPVPEPINSVPLLGSLARIISFVAWDRTPLLGYLLVFGIFVFPLVSFLALKLWPYLREPYAYLDRRPAPEPEAVKPAPDTNWGYIATGIGLTILAASLTAFYLLKSNGLFTALLALAAAPLLAFGLAALAWQTLARYRSRRPGRELLAATGFLAALLVLGGWFLRFELGGPLLITGVAAALLLWLESRPSPVTISEPDLENDPGIETPTLSLPPSAFHPQPSALSLQPLADLFALTMLLLGVLLTIVTELIIIRDVFNSRLNTVFKFYYQTWVLFGLAAAYASWRVTAWAWRAAPFDQAGSRPEAGELYRSEQPRLASEPVRQPQPASLRLQPAGPGGPLAAPWSFLAGLPSAGSPGSQPHPARPDKADWLEVDDAEAEEAEDYNMARPGPAWWRWLWCLGLGLLLLAGLIYPVFGPFEKSGRYAKQSSLDGSLWLRDGGPTGPAMPEDYRAIVWLQEQLKANPGFAGTILETSGPDWVDYSRVSTFTGLPTLMGWIGHENQWRGGKANARPDVFDCGRTMAQYGLRPPPPGLPSQQKDEPWCRLQLVDFLYKTDNVKVARELLQIAGVRYVFVGSLEQSWNDSGRTPAKNYPPEGLAKFEQFMRVIYRQDGVTIYSF